MQEKYKTDFIHVGKLAREVRRFGLSLIKKGASYNEIIEKINEKIFSLDAFPAFPPQIALNEVAAHYLPSVGEDHIFSDEVIKLDIGVCYNGAIGDCAASIDLSGRHQELIDAAEAALLAAEQMIKVGTKFRDIGAVIEKTIVSCGFRSIRNLSGHGLGVYKVHTPPTVPNYDNHSNEVVKPGMTFAVEPFATTGKGMVYDAGKPTIFSLIAKRKMNPPIAAALLQLIMPYQQLPFSIHNLQNNGLSPSEVETGIAELIRAKVIVGYAPLIEEAHGMVAQAENSVLVDLGGNVLVTTREL